MSFPLACRRQTQGERGPPFGSGDLACVNRPPPSNTTGEHLMARELIFDIFAIDRASKVFTKVGTEAEGLGSKTLKAMNVVGAATAAAIAAVGVMSVKNAMAMQESDAKIQGNALITAAAAKGIGDTFLGTAMKSTFSG